MVASPPPPPGFGVPSGPPGFGEPTAFPEQPSEPMEASSSFTPPAGPPGFSSQAESPEMRTAEPAAVQEAPEYREQSEQVDQQPEQSEEEQAQAAYDQQTAAEEAMPDMQAADQAMEQEEVIEQEGINNFDVEGSGNWLLKRVWWEKTEEVYEEIKVVFNQVLETRGQFITARNKLDRELDIFYGEMGLEQGPLHDIITHILDLMEKRRKAQGDVLTPAEEALVKKTEEKEPVLAQLKLDVKAIQAVEDKLDQALTTLFKQIDVCNEYEQRAWNNFKDIARELNDKEARKSYYQTQALLDDIKKIQAYLNGAFSSYFEQTVQLARDHAQKITANMQNLRNQGIDLQKEAQILENDRDQPKKQQVKKEEVKKPQVGFFGKISQFFSDLFSKLFGWFGAEKTQVKTRTKKAVDSVEQKTEQAVQAVKQQTKQDVKRVQEEVDQVAEDFAHDYQTGMFGQPSLRQGYGGQVVQTDNTRQVAPQAVSEDTMQDMNTSMDDGPDSF